MGYTLSFLALYCWFLCFTESQPQHTLLGGKRCFPQMDPTSLGESVLLSKLFGTAHASTSRKLPLWFCCSDLHSYGTFFQGPCLYFSSLSGMQLSGECPKGKDTAEFVECSQHPAQNPTAGLMKSLWNKWMNNRKWIPQNIVIQIEGHSRSKLAIL